MAKKSKLTICKYCGATIAANVKHCPQCGGKNSKPIYKKWWFWVIVILLIGGVGSSGEKTESTEDESSSISETKEISEQTPEEVEPEVELSSEFERAIWEVVHKYDGELLSIETTPEASSDETAVVVGVLCENDEEIVNSILNDASSIISSNDTNESVIFTFGDIDDGEDSEMLIMAGIYNDGTIDIAMTSPNYNSARNEWINDQFSSWDGTHYVLESLIIENLNDEDSYEHIETKYRDIDSEDIRDEINSILSESGYSNRVEIGDLFIQTEFSAANAFGGTVKSVAYGISSQANGSTTLIAIE